MKGVGVERLVPSPESVFPCLRNKGKTNSVVLGEILGIGGVLRGNTIRGNRPERF